MEAVKRNRWQKQTEQLLIVLDPVFAGALKPLTSIICEYLAIRSFYNGQIPIQEFDAYPDGAAYSRISFPRHVYYLTFDAIPPILRFHAKVVYISMNYDYFSLQSIDIHTKTALAQLYLTMRRTFSRPPLQYWCWWNDELATATVETDLGIVFLSILN